MTKALTGVCHPLLTLLLWASTAAYCQTSEKIDANLALPDAVVTHGEGHIQKAWLTHPTRHYPHGVLGDDIEATGLRVVLASGEIHDLRLTDESVFEDRYPRLADVDDDGKDEIVLVRSYPDRGAALAVLEVEEEGIIFGAEADPIGKSFRWLNPVGSGDFDGDGRTEIAAVIKPHLAGSLAIYRYHDGALTPVYRGGRFSNHALGSRNLGLSATADIDGDGHSEIILPAFDRYSLILIRYENGQLVEIDRLLQDSRISGDIRLSTTPSLGISFELEDGSLIYQAIGSDGFD